MNSVKNKISNLIISIVFIDIIVSYFIKCFPMLESVGEYEIRQCVALARGIEDNNNQNSFSNILKDSINGVNEIATQKIPEKTTFIELNGLYSKILGKRVIDDADKEYNVAKLDNGMLSFLNHKIDTEEYAKNMNEFNQFLKTEIHVPLFYVQALIS